MQQLVVVVVSLVNRPQRLRSTKRAVQLRAWSVAAGWVVYRRPEALHPVLADLLVQEEEEEEGRQQQQEAQWVVMLLCMRIC
jgi:hypothetical protein